MVVDFTVIANALLALAAAAITTAIPILVPAMLKRLHIAGDADLAGKLDAAAAAAAGVAYNYALAHEGGLKSVPVKNAAVAAGADYVMAAMPDALKHLGITPAAVADMVQARLGKLLAADPTVSAGAPPVLPAPANANAPQAGVVVSAVGAPPS